MNGNDTAVVIRATGDACQLARAYGCQIHLEIGGRNPIKLDITPDGAAQLDVARDELPASKSQADA